MDIDARVDELDKKFTELDKDIQKFKNLLWVLGTLAVIFGISGAWGWKVLQEAQAQISGLQNTTNLLQTQVAGLQGQIQQAEKVFAAARAKAEAQFMANLSGLSADHISNVEQTVNSRLQKQYPSTVLLPNSNRSPFINEVMRVMSGMKVPIELRLGSPGQLKPSALEKELNVAFVPQQAPLPGGQFLIWRVVTTNDGQ